MNREENLLRLIDTSQIIVQWPKGKSNYKARVTVNFGNMGLVIKGFLIHERSGQTWVTPPQYTNITRTTSHDLCFIENKEAWKYLEAKIIDKYINKLNEPWDKQDDAAAMAIVDDRIDNEMASGPY